MSQVGLSIGALDVPLTVQRVELREGLSSPTQATVFATTPLPALSPSMIVGQTASIALSGGGLFGIFDFDLLGERTWTGVCRSVTLVNVEHSGVSTYRFDVVAVVVLLSLRRSYRVFQDVSAPKIAANVLEAAGLSVSRNIDDDAHPRRELRVQYGETDASFVDRMLEEAGVAYITAASGEIVLSDRWHSGECRLVPLSYVDNPAEALGRPFVTKVSLSSELRPSAVSLGDYDFRNPARPLLAAAKTGAEIEGAFAVEAFQSGASLVGVAQGAGTPAADERGAFRHDERAANAHAGRLLASLREGRDEVRFATNVADLAPGEVFRIEGYPHPALSPDTRLLCTGIDIEAEFGKPARIRCRAVMADAPYVPPLRTEKPRVHGMVGAVVVGPKGQEIHTDEFGRVRIQFAWDRNGKLDEKSSCWVRVSQAWAGPGYGSFMLPRVGHEVLVGFVDGDPDRPVVVGSLHNALAVTPHKLPMDQAVSGIRTQSTPNSEGWNELRFDDRAGKELLAMRAERDMTKLVRHDEHEKTGNDRTLEVGHDLRVNVEGNETRQTDGNREVKIGANDKTRIDGSRTTTIGGSDTIVAQDKHTVQVGPAKTGAVIENEKIALRTSGAALSMDGPDVDVSASGTIRLRAAGNVIIEADGDVSVTAAGNVVVNGSATRVNS